MRYLLCTLFLLISTTAYTQNSEVVRLSEPVSETEDYEIFGSEMDLEQSSSILSLTEAISGPAMESEILIQAKVNKVCQKKGCFFIAVDDESTARVTFKDYGFFIPTNSSGKEVLFRGLLSEKILSEDQARHFAEDAGENGEEIEGEQKEYSIVATSVMIPKSK